MNELTVARERPSPAPPDAGHFDAPAGWSAWIAQILAEDRPVGAAVALRMGASAPSATPFVTATAILRDALRDAQDAACDTDAWAAAAAGHQVFLARRRLRTLLDAALGTGPGTRLEWCTCGEDPPAA